ncbi:MAG: TolC family protein [Pseudomonadota bacterium]
MRTAAVALVAACVAGCAPVGPDFVRPDVDLQPAWLAAERAEFETTQAGLVDWWRQLNDPVLDRLISLAYERNNSIKISGLRVLQAQAALNIAVGNQYPQTQVAVGDITAIGTSENAENGDRSETSFRQANIAGSVAWEMDFWGRFRRGVEAADASLSCSSSVLSSAYASATPAVTMTMTSSKSAMLASRLASAASTPRAWQTRMRC